jgi:hypothetical protein
MILPKSSIDMHEPFLVVVDYLGHECEFKARFERWGYSYRIAVLIEDRTVTFEPDEEGFFRAIGSDEVRGLDLALLKVVAEKLQQLTR